MLCQLTAWIRVDLPHLADGVTVQQNSQDGGNIGAQTQACRDLDEPLLNKANPT